MPKEIAITIANKLLAGKRDLNIYHHAESSTHLISHGNSRSLRLTPEETGDYLHISIPGGPGPLTRNCLIDLPWWLDIEFISEGKIALAHSFELKRMLLTLPPGPPAWQLRVTWRTSGQKIASQAYITVSDAAS